MKNPTGILRIVAWFFMAVGLGAAPAWAGGIAWYEIGTPDVGLAAAGWAARAHDASTLFKNPAGMSLLPKSEFQVGAQAGMATSSSVRIPVPRRPAMTAITRWGGFRGAASSTSTRSRRS